MVLYRIQASSTEILMLSEAAWYAASIAGSRNFVTMANVGVGWGLGTLGQKILSGTPLEDDPLNSCM